MSSPFFHKNLIYQINKIQIYVVLISYCIFFWNSIFLWQDAKINLWNARLYKNTKSHLSRNKCTFVITTIFSYFCHSLIFFCHFFIYSIKGRIQVLSWLYNSLVNNYGFLFLYNRPVFLKPQDIQLCTACRKYRFPDHHSTDYLLHQRGS